ncbi:MAG: HAD family hydrolase [Limnothrix sp.]
MNITRLLQKATAQFRASQSPGGRRLSLTLFCDFDGPLVDVSCRYYETYKTALYHTQQTFQKQGLSVPLRVLSKAEFWAMKRSRTRDIEIAMKSGLEEEQVPFFLNYVQEIVNAADLLDLDRMQTSVNWSLALLHSYGVKLVLVTLREEQQVKRMLAQYGLTRLFADIYGSGDRHTAYQNNIDVKTALLKEAITEQGQISDHWLMVGDTEADIVAAQRMSIPAIALTCGIRDEQYLKTYNPDYLCADLLSTAHLLLEHYGQPQPKTSNNYCFSSALT